MRERTNSLVFGGPLLTPISSLDNTPPGKRRRRSNSINDSPNSRLRSPDRAYNISSKTGPNDQNYEDISRRINDHKELMLLRAFNGNKPGYSYAAMNGPSADMTDGEIANDVLSVLGTSNRKTAKPKPKVPKAKGKTSKLSKAKVSKEKTSKRKPSKEKTSIFKFPHIDIIKDPTNRKPSKRKRGGSTKTKKRKRGGSTKTKKRKIKEKNQGKK